MGFGQGLSGLNAAASNLDVIGNNVANQSTVGFKTGSATFADVFASSRVGLGVQVSGVNQKFTVGSITSTSNELDMAITGANGFFRLVDTDGSVLYSRNGQFSKDSQGNIVNAQGQQLTGYPVGSVGADPVALTVPTGNIAPEATRTVEVSSLNLDKDADAVTNTTFDIEDESSYTSTSPASVYDSMGTEHMLRQYYAKSSTDNEWNVYYVLDGDTSNIQQAKLSFDENGVLTDPTTPVALTFDVSPAADLEVNFDYGSGKTTQFAAEYGLEVIPDGYASGQFNAVEIAGDGTLYATYSNGERLAFGIVALASFVNTQGLQPAGDNAWTETSASGAPTLGQPGSNGLGQLTGQAVEASNVDISAELVNMIIAQRTYQANAQTIKTQDNILQTLVTMR